MTWSFVELKTVTENLDYKRKPLNDIERQNISLLGLYPYIGANNIMGFVDEYLFDGEILCIAEDGGNWGAQSVCAKIFNEKCWVNNHAHVLRANGKLHLPFLMYYLNYQDLSKYVTGSTRGKLTKSALDSIPIPLPPLAVQKRIAEILDAADALRKKDQELLKKYDELAQAIFIDMFGDPVKNEKGWVVKRLGEIQETKSQNGLYVAKENYSEYAGVEMVHMSDAFNGKVIQGSLKRVVISESEKRKYNLTDDDILVARRSLNYEGAVKPCLVETNGNPLVYESSLIRIVVDKKIIDPLYLFFFFSNERAKKEYILKYVTKSTISGINNENLNKVEILVPSLKLQHVFKSRILEIENIISLQSKNESNSLFNSLLSSAFSGELVS